MRKSVYGTLAALMFAAVPFAAQADVRVAQAADVPEKCAQLQDAQARADCIRQEKGSQ